MYACDLSAREVAALVPAWARQRVWGQHRAHSETALQNQPSKKQLLHVPLSEAARRERGHPSGGAKGGFCLFVCFLNTFKKCYFHVWLSCLRV